MVPPQERPTFHAVSSATPNSSTFGLPLSITSRASATTAPSTQPPETEPRKFPASSMTRLAPTGRGAEPQVSITVASATPRPLRRHSSAAFRISSSRASMISSFPSRVRFTSIQIWLERDGTAMPMLVRSSDLPQPLARWNRTRRIGREGAAKVGDRLEIVDRAELVDMRQHHLDAFRLGLEAVEAQQ